MSVFHTAKSNHSISFACSASLESLLPIRALLVEIGNTASKSYGIVFVSGNTLPLNALHLNERFVRKTRAIVPTALVLKVLS